MSWIGYCNKEKCIIQNEMFVINRKFGRKTLSHERTLFSCPICLSGDVRIRNIGFVNCRWQLKGNLRKSRGDSTKVSTEGQTYDGKLHTFQEMDYLADWATLDFLISAVDKKVQNMPSSRTSERDCEFEGSEIAESRPKFLGPNSEISQLSFNEPGVNSSVCCCATKQLGDRENDKSCVIF